MDTTPSPAPVKAPPTLLGLAVIFVREGNMTFGGGLPTVAALQRELVTNKGWLTQDGYTMCHVLSRITPGTNLWAFCVAAGWILRRWSGVAVAMLAGSIPSSLLVALLTGGFDAWSSKHWLQIAINAVLASSVGILLAGFWLLVRPHWKPGRKIQTLLIVCGSIFLSIAFGMTPLAVLALAAVVGFFMPGGDER